MEVPPTASGPLVGLRIVAVEQFGAGPLGSLFLADLGADVVKVEDPSTGGDISRYVPPGTAGTDSLFFEAFNRGKRSIALDLKHPSGRAVFERLVAAADAVYSNLRGDQPARLGLRHADLAGINPRVVCVALTGYGSGSDQAHLPGYDALIQAESGWASLTGDPEGPPTKSGPSLADYIGGLTAALALLAGVHEARATGVGRDLDTSLYDAALAMLSYSATWYLSRGHVSPRRPMSAHPSVVPFQFFRTADGHVAVACAKEKFVTALLRALDLDEFARDARFASFEARGRHRTELLVALEERFVLRTTAAWLTLLRGVVPIAPVRSMEEALDPVDLQRRSMLSEYSHPTLGSVRSVGLPIHVVGYVPEYRAAPQLGADRDVLLAALGYAPTEIADLARAGAFGSLPEALPPPRVAAD